MEILAEDIRPATDLKNKSTQLLRQVQTTRRPILLTPKGKPAAILVAVKEFAEKDLEEIYSYIAKDNPRGRFFQAPSPKGLNPSMVVSTLPQNPREN